MVIALGPIGHRIAIGVGANALGKIWVALAQLASIPILAGTWGVDRFGLWLMITTVPTYIALTSTGFNSVAGVDIARSYNDQKLDEAKSTYQSVWLFISALTGAIVSIGLLIRLALAATGDSDRTIGEWEAGDTAAAILVYAFLVIQSSIVLAVYRAVSRYAQGTIFYDLIGLVESIAVIAITVSGGGLFAAAMAMISIRSIGIAGLHFHISRREHWARVGVTAAKLSEIRRLLHPSLGALTVAGGNALSIQGVVVALGLAVGPSATAAFVSARTIARLPLQFSDLLGRASMPEMARTWFGPDQHVFWRLTWLNVAFALAILVPSCLLMLAFGTEVARWISRGHVPYEPWLAPSLGLVALLQGTSVAVGQSIAAQNRQHAYGYIYLGLAVVMCFAPFLVRGGIDPTTMTALWIAACEGVGLAFVIKSLLRSQSQGRVRVRLSTPVD